MAVPVLAENISLTGNLDIVGGDFSGTDLTFVGTAAAQTFIFDANHEFDSVTVNNADGVEMNTNATSGLTVNNVTFIDGALMITNSDIIVNDGGSVDGASGHGCSLLYYFNRYHW